MSNGSAAGAAHSLQLSIDRLHNWGQKWKIAFEPTKSQAMTATLRRADLHLPPIMFGGIQVPEANSITILGVLFDRKLSFGEHLRSVATRARQRLGLLRRSAHLLPLAGRINSVQSIRSSAAGVCRTYLDWSVIQPPQPTGPSPAQGLRNHRSGSNPA